MNYLNCCCGTKHTTLMSENAVTVRFGRLMARLLPPRSSRAHALPAERTLRSRRQNVQQVFANTPAHKHTVTENIGLQ